MMRTNIVIDDKLMAKALQASGLKAKRETVEAGLRLLLKVRSQVQTRNARGKLHWDGDFDAMRSDA